MPEMEDMPVAVEALAERLARDLHAGQVDKAGMPYSEHLRRTAESVSSPLTRAVAWLHDVLEDTTVTTDQLRATGVPERVVAAVEALTRRDDEPPIAYYRRVRADPLALEVKLADLDDNTDPARLGVLPADVRVRLERKYAAARHALTAA